MWLLTCRLENPFRRMIVVHRRKSYPPSFQARVPFRPYIYIFYLQ
jgi:hypothetical protein